MGWGSQTFPITSFDQSSLTIGLGSGGWQIGDTGGAGQHFYVEGVLQELDAPREWHVDPDTRTLYILPNQTLPVPPTPAPGAMFSIQLKSSAVSKCSSYGKGAPCCLDLQYWSPAEHANFAADNCHPSLRGENQAFEAGANGQLKIELGGFSKCLTATVSSSSTTTEGAGFVASIEAVTCGSGGIGEYQSWSMNADGTLSVKIDTSSLCLSGASGSAGVVDGGKLGVAACNAEDPFQQWVKGNSSRSSRSSHASSPPPPPSLTEAVLLDTVVHFAGTATAPVRYVAMDGVRIAHAATTQLKRYEVPSGGDWAVGRYGAVVIEGAAGVSVTNCYFDRVGGNAVLLNNFAKNNTVAFNRISFPGDSGVIATGTSNMVDGTGDTFPEGNIVEGNWIHDIGTYGKQVSCYFQSVSGGNIIKDNICYNGPRAGINFNDGFRGGNLVQGNLVFNMVRETGDHGPFNSWDRVPYVTKREDGSSTPIPLRHHIHRNLIINGYNGVWSLDHDDGSSYYNDTSNVLVYGGCKNYKGDHKICGPDNFIVFPGIDARSSGGRSCQTNDNAGFYSNYYIGNKCVQYDGQFYTFQGNPLDKTKVPFTAQNQFYSSGAKFDYGGKGLADLQKIGLDVGSSVLDMPSLDEIVQMAKETLGFSV